MPHRENTLEAETTTADLAAGDIRPILHQVFPLAEAPEAHRTLQASTHFGKVVLAVR